MTSSSTLNNAYTALIDSMANTAQDHVTLADSLQSQVADTLKVIEKKNENSKKKLSDFFTKLLTERDKTYGDRQKVSSPQMRWYASRDI
jgi:glutamate racemase